MEQQLLMFLWTCSSKRDCIRCKAATSATLLEPKPSTELHSPLLHELTKLLEETTQQVWCAAEIA